MTTNLISTRLQTGQFAHTLPGMNLSRVRNFWYLTTDMLLVCRKDKNSVLALNYSKEVLDVEHAPKLVPTNVLR